MILVSKIFRTTVSYALKSVTRRLLSSEATAGEITYKTSEKVWT